MNLGINLGFALKRWPEPERWASIVRDDLGLDLVQFTFDLLDPWWPQRAPGTMAGRVRQAAEAFDLTIHSAQLGLAWYTYNGFLHPDPPDDSGARVVAAGGRNRGGDRGAGVGGPLGALSVDEAADPARSSAAYAALLDDVIAASEAAAAAGLEALLVEPTPAAARDPAHHRRGGAAGERSPRSHRRPIALGARHRPRPLSAALRRRRRPG